MPSSSAHREVRLPYRRLIQEHSNESMLMNGTLFGLHREHLVNHAKEKRDQGLTGGALMPNRKPWAQTRRTKENRSQQHLTRHHVLLLLKSLTQLKRTPTPTDQQHTHSSLAWGFNGQQGRPPHSNIHKKLSNEFKAFQHSEESANSAPLLGLDGVPHGQFSHTVVVVFFAPKVLSSTYKWTVP